MCKISLYYSISIPYKTKYSQQVIPKQQILWMYALPVNYMQQNCGIATKNWLLKVAKLILRRKQINITDRRMQSEPKLGISVSWTYLFYGWSFYICSCLWKNYISLVNFIIIFVANKVFNFFSTKETLLDINILSRSTFSYKIQVLL